MQGGMGAGPHGSGALGDKGSHISFKEGLQIPFRRDWLSHFEAKKWVSANTYCLLVPKAAVERVIVIGFGPDFALYDPWRPRVYQSSLRQPGPSSKWKCQALVTTNCRGKVRAISTSMGRGKFNCNQLVGHYITCVFCKQISHIFDISLHRS